MALTYKQAKLVRDSVPVLREHGERISSIFYATMLDEHPELRDYFNTTNQQSGRQPRALTAIILAFASNISHTSELVPRLERVCHKHCSLNIQPQQYAIVGEYLIRAFREVLGSGMTTELQSAWTDAYCVLARMMMGRESHLYRSFDSWQGWRRMRIDRKVKETNNVYSFYLVPTSTPSVPSAPSVSSIPSAHASNSLALPKPLPARPNTSSHRSNSVTSDQSRLGRTGRLRARLTGRSIPSNSSHVSLASTTTTTTTTTTTSTTNTVSSIVSSTVSSHSSAIPHSLAPPPSAAPAALPHFLPGQYVSVRLPLPPAACLPGMTFQTRQYSLSDRWCPDYYRISVKRDIGTRFANAVSVSYSEPGLVSNALIDHLEVGDTIDVSHPTGEFFLTTLDDSPGSRKSSAHSSSAANSNVPLVLISAGIGAAPMMAMLSTVAISQPRRAISYVHGCHCSPPVFDSQIRELQRQLPRLRTAYFFSGSSSDVASDAASSITPPSSHADSVYAWKPRSIAPSFTTSDAPDNRPSSSGRASIQPSTALGSHTIQPPTYEFSGRIDLSRLVPGVSDTYPLSSSSDGTETPPTPTNNIDDEDLLHLGNNSTEYFVCGPEAFMLDMAVCLVHGFGVSRSRIRYELFSTGDIETEQQDSRMSYIR